MQRFKLPAQAQDVVVARLYQWPLLPALPRYHAMVQLIRIRIGEVKRENLPSPPSPGLTLRDLYIPNCRVVAKDSGWQFDAKAYRDGQSRPKAAAIVRDRTVKGVPPRARRIRRGHGAMNSMLRAIFDRIPARSVQNPACSVSSPYSPRTQR